MERRTAGQKDRKARSQIDGWMDGWDATGWDGNEMGGMDEMDGTDGMYRKDGMDGVDGADGVDGTGRDGTGRNGMGWDVFGGWMHGCMDGWMDGWMEGWRDGGMEGWRDGGREGGTDGGVGLEINPRRKTPTTLCQETPTYSDPGSIRYNV